MQVASVGLLHAIDRYDPSRGKAFLSFAVPTILGELKRHFRDKGWSIHFPRGLHDLVQRVQAAEQQLMATSNRSPTVVEIAGHLGVQTERVLDALEAARSRIAVSLDQPIQGETDAEAQSWHDRVGSEDEGFGLVEARVSLPPAVTRLPASDRELLALRYQAQLTQHQIAARVGVSQMSISRRLRAATDRLRDELYGSPASAPPGGDRATLAPPSPAGG
jgi:RNA polymerase sigma-B factor